MSPTTPELAELLQLRTELEKVRFDSRPDAWLWRRSWRQKQRWDHRWARGYTKFLRKQTPSDDALRATLKRTQRRVLKAAGPADVLAWLRAEVAEAAFAFGAMKMYLGFALDESEEAGQYTLDGLGLDETFRWTGIEDLPQGTAQVEHYAASPWQRRGSKIIQGIYGQHLDQLARHVLKVASPRARGTVNDLTREVRHEWDALSRREAERIARTEAAYVWETTSFNANVANGVERFEWLVATGPSVGPPKSYPVCTTCIKHAASSPWTPSELLVVEGPPAHPHCRCTLLPVLDAEWLPPKEPWTGEEMKLVVR